MQQTMLLFLRAATGVLCAGLATDALPHGVEGQVLHEDKPLVGVRVTATELTGKSMTVYTDERGRFRIGGLSEEISAIRAVHHGFTSVTIANAKFDKPLRFDLAPDANAWRSTPSSKALAGLPEGSLKQRLILNCTSCHTLASDRILVEGRARTSDEWKRAIHMMRAIDGYDLIAPALDPDQYGPWLAEHLSVKAAASAHHPVSGSRQGQGVITEYPSPEPDELLHDIAVGPDGRIWVTAFFHGEMWALEPTSGAVRRYALPNATGATLEVRALQLDAAGDLWIVLGGSKEVVRLTPASGEVKVFPVGMYAHDIVLDSRGDVWLNDYFSDPERIGKLTVATGQVEYFQLPPSGLPAIEGKPLPYGMQIDRQDRLWCTQLGGNTLVRFDTRTRASKLYVMPAPGSGPRRLSLDPQGQIWIPEYATGYVTRFDPTNETFMRVSLGDSAAGPYAVAIDPANAAIWITGTLSSDLIRLDPRTQEIERFPLPSEPAYMRHLAVDARTGDVWTAYASFPAAAPKIVRLRRDQR